MAEFVTAIRKLKRKIAAQIETRYLAKDKTCCVCEHFRWYMGSAGVCVFKKGCPANHMIDCMNSCDCGGFKKKKNVKGW